MTAISHRILRNGVLNLPRPSPTCKTSTENLLWTDAQNHHAYFNQAGFHNHLSHHILAAYDLGASPGLLQKIYDDEAKTQRPIVLDEEKNKAIHVTEENWDQYLGNSHAYSGFLSLFQNQIVLNGAVKTLAAFVFSESVNEKGKVMLTRLMSGVQVIVHPFILYGLEFGNDAVVAIGLASAAIHQPTAEELFQAETEPQPSPPSSDNDLTVLEILSLVYASPILKPPMPYDPNALLSTRIKSALSDGRLAQLRSLCSKFYVPTTLSSEEMDHKIEQLVWAAILSLFSTGKEGRKPRLDFFLMHLVTSSIFLKSYNQVLEDPAHRAMIVKAFLPVILLYVMARGRPVIQPHLVMQATDKPRPPYGSTPPYVFKGTGLGSPLTDEDYNPWPALIEASLYSSDSHVLKTMRALVFAAREYGDVSAGAVVGAVSETIPGIAKLDGSMFVRAAGMLMDYMGWTTYGQKERYDWDRSALGWEDAWKGGDEN
ncbi:hypothetical protein D9757_001125 [Collybiopsis confluens]|uniref:Oxidoreductase AflY n=1 Tax=Collybiopsis confluens TaxID=2823264 RepID=A0A8H5I0P8_9AGAR|nr:hypothetical protein D9757_001125 [Collybiopsis confluens]